MLLESEAFAPRVPRTGLLAGFDDPDLVLFDRSGRPIAVTPWIPPRGGQEHGVEGGAGVMTPPALLAILGSPVLDPRPDASSSGASMTPVPPSLVEGLVDCIEVAVCLHPDDQSSKDQVLAGIQRLASGPRAPGDKAQLLQAALLKVLQGIDPRCAKVDSSEEDQP